MKHLILFPFIAVTILLSGCKGGPNILGPDFVQQGVATGVAFSSVKHPEAVPYLRLSESVICSVANSTNIAPADVTKAINESPSAGALKTPEGVLILNAALTLYTGIWNSYGSNAVAQVPQLQPYLQATCRGLGQGLPSMNLKAAVPSITLENPAWPQVK